MQPGTSLFLDERAGYVRATASSGPRGNPTVPTDEQASSLDARAARLGMTTHELRAMTEQAMGAASARSAKQAGHNRQTADDLREYNEILAKYSSREGEPAATLMERISDPGEKERAWTLYRRLGAG